MIRCYYSKETIERVAKAGRNRLIFDGGFWGGLMVLGFVLWNRLEPAPGLLFPCIFFCGVLYYIHRHLLHVEKTILQHAGDEITLDNDKIQLTQTDGTQLILPQKELKIEKPVYVFGKMIFRITNSQFVPGAEITLTSDMENAKELVETIQPGLWDWMDPS